MTYVGIGLLFLGAFNTFLSMGGTCTGGSADELAGGYISLILYPVGFALLFFGRSSKLTWTLITTIPIIWMQASFFTRLLYAYLFLDYPSACDALQRTTGQLADGGELYYLLLWGAVNAVFLAGLLAVCWRGKTHRANTNSN